MLTQNIPSVDGESRRLTQIRKLQGDLAKAKDRLRDASATFTHLGRLHAFLQTRGQADGTRVTAGLAAMGHIHGLGRACQVAKQCLAGARSDPQAVLCRLGRVLPPEE